MNIPRPDTVYMRQGHCALDTKILANYPPAGVSLDSIGELLEYDLTQLPKPGNRPWHVG